MSTIHASILFRAPEVSHADIESFHAAHFSADAIDLFSAQFLRPEFAHDDNADYYGYDEGREEDDDLGYYPDGVKRTLTDEQIAIFRHSELEALRRAEITGSKPEIPGNLDNTSGAVGGEPVGTPTELGEVLSNADTADDALDGAVEGSEDGEIETEKLVLTKAEARRQKKLRARQRKREAHKFQPEKKPDLRKRTWDVVEAGMDSLHYDDLGMSQDHGSASTTQRRQISYDD